jgi:hypothetical protein
MILICLIKGENTQVWFALVLVGGRGGSCKYAVYLTKSTLRDLMDEKWVGDLYLNAKKDFENTAVDSGGDISALWRSYVDYIDSVLRAVRRYIYSEDLLKRVGGSYQFVFVGKRKIGVNQGGSLRLYYTGSERGVLRMFSRSAAFASR